MLTLHEILAVGLLIVYDDWFGRACGWEYLIFPLCTLRWIASIKDRFRYLFILHKLYSFVTLTMKFDYGQEMAKLVMVYEWHYL